jgi:sigma-B regulation protein RsbU (phosphoserine phosphatase)
VQSQLIPINTPQLAGWEFAASWQPAREVSGDYYDFIQNKGKLGIVIADVSGKGMHAALFMASTRSIIRAKATASLTPAESLIQANSLICEDAARGMFVTLFYAEIDPQTQTLTYVNCGHNPPYWYRAGQREIAELPPTGSVLGINDSIQYTQQQIDIESGDFITLFTDGITEAFNNNDEQFGEERLKMILNQYAGESPQRIFAEIQKELESFVGSAPQSDDRTIVLAKFVTPAAP